MPPVVVRVADIVNLELKCVLQVVPRLLSLEARYDSRAFRDVHDHQTTGLGQIAGDFPKPFGNRNVVVTGAQLQLTQRTDVAQSRMP
jgi:hypothetical protein